jgi:DNA-binding transcriptional ArsR family regulator
MILYQLRKGELAAGHVASRFPISGPSISRHLAVLKAAGLVVERRQANKILYSLVPGRLAESVGAFLAAVGADQAPMADRPRRKAKAAEKQAPKQKRKQSVQKSSDSPG